MKKFNRNTDGSLITEMKATALWKKHLESDCANGKVFLAIRDKAIDFYYKGGRLFRFDKNGYGTDLKYASVIDTDKAGFIPESKLGDLKPIKDFSSGYEHIKDRCKNYANHEAKSVASLYSKYSCVSGRDVFVLDIEIAFPALKEGDTQDRIDILLYDKADRVLYFVESKQLSDSRLVSTTKPEVIEQLNRYEKQFQARQKDIVLQYCLYVENLNTVFDMNLPHPQNVDIKPILWIFGYKSGDEALTKLKKNPHYKGVKIYTSGEAKQTSPEGMVKATRT
jgi:hypothetical protein